MSDAFIYLGLYDSEEDVIRLFVDRSSGSPLIFDDHDLAYKYMNEMNDQGIFATVIVSKIPLGKTYGLPS